MKGLTRICARGQVPKSRLPQQLALTAGTLHKQQCARITSLHAPPWQRTRGFALPASPPVKQDKKERIVILGSGWAGEYLALPGNDH